MDNPKHSALPTTSFQIQVSELHLAAKKGREFRLPMDGNEVLLPVADILLERFKNDFVRSNPTPKQRREYNTLMELMRAAYRQGLVDGRQQSKGSKCEGG